MFTTYIIQSESTGRFYIGSTGNIEERIQQHNSGWTKSTRNRGPFSLVYSEEYNSRAEAMKREKEIKGYKGGNSFKKLIRSGAGVVNRNRL